MDKHCECGQEGCSFPRTYSVGSVVITEGDRGSIVSKLIAYFMKSWWTHSFLVIGPNKGVEADFPQVKTFLLCDRFRELHKQERSWVALERPGMTLAQKAKLVRKARSYVGRFYDVGQLLIWAANYSWSWLRWKIAHRGKPSGQFYRDGEGTLVCSRLVTASYWSGLGVALFPEEVLDANYAPDHPRLGNLRNGYATPPDFLRSTLVPTRHMPSERYPTRGKIWEGNPPGLHTPKEGV